MTNTQWILIRGVSMEQAQAARWGLPLIEETEDGVRVDVTPNGCNSREIAAVEMIAARARMPRARA